MSRMRHQSTSRLRSRVVLALSVAAIAALVGACTPEPDPGTPPGTTTTTTTTVPSGPTITGQACQPGSGVTVVVDFTTLDDTIRIGCAPGAQASGLSALIDAGFTPASDGSPTPVCKIDGLPTEGFPFCWTTGGYWSYWKSPDRSTPWAFSPVGANAGPLTQGSVEGWSWAPSFTSNVPRVAVDDLDDHTPTLPACATPEAPVLSIIDDDEVLPFTIEGGGPIEIATQPVTANPSDAVYVTASSLALSGLSGPTRVLARSGGDCIANDRFEAVYDIRATYSGRPDVAGSTSDAVSATSPSVLSWASGVAAYSPGADVTATFQTPNNAVGPYSTSIVSLGNGGSVTLSFDSPIHDGAGNDFAVFENGFMSNPTAEMLFTELAYVEVSSNGTDFVRFDSASRQPNAVGAFDYQDPRLIGGLAGKDPGGWGTTFDLRALANSPAVRNGTVNLTAITHVRLVDIVGASDYPNPGDTYLDSFGRQIFDTHKTTGSGGFDLRAIGVLNTAPAA